MVVTIFIVITFTRYTLTTNLFVKEIQSLGIIVQIFHVHSKISGLKASLANVNVDGLDFLKRIGK